MYSQHLTFLLTYEWAQYARVCPLQAKHTSLRTVKHTLLLWFHTLTTLYNRPKTLAYYAEFMRLSAKRTSLLHQIYAAISQTH